MGNTVCTKCGLSHDSGLVRGHYEERRHCFAHNIKNNICTDCDDMNSSRCYHSFSYNILHLRDRLSEFNKIQSINSGKISRNIGLNICT